MMKSLSPPKIKHRAQKDSKIKENLGRVESSLGGRQGLERESGKTTGFTDRKGKSTPG